MSGVAFRLAWDAARDKSRQHRWRLIALPVLAIVVGVIVGASISVLAWRDAAEGRAADRRLVVAEGVSDPATYYRPGLEFWKGRRIHVAWISPAGSIDDAPLPPGVPEFPEPGQAYVSEALADLVAEEGALATLLGDARIISAAGAVSGTELVAYVRPEAGRQIGYEEDALRLEGGRPVGQPSVVRVSGFGEQGLAPFADEQQAVWLAPLMVVLFGLLPGLLVLLTAMSISSRSRDRRLQLLRSLGLPQTRVRVIGAGESVMLAAPGIVAGLVLWQFLARSHLVTTAVPQVLPGDLVVSGRLLLLELLLAALMLVGAALVSSALEMRSGTIVTTERTRASRTGIVLVVVSAVLFATSAMTGVGATLPLRPMGSLVAVAAAAFVLPEVFARVGARLAEADRLTVGLVGRGMHYDPRRSAAPFVGITAIVALGMLTSTFFASADAMSKEKTLAHGGLESASVVWGDVRPQDAEDFRRALRADGADLTAIQVGAADGDHDHDHGHDQAGGLHLQVGAACAELEAVAPVGCSASGEESQGVVELFGRALGEPVASVDFVAPSEVSGAGRILVLGDGDLVDLDAAVRAAAHATVPAPRIDSDVFFRYPELSSLYQMLLKGLLTALAALTLAVIVSCIDRLRGEAPRYARLWRVGASVRSIKHFAVQQFLVGTALALGTGLVFGQIIWSQSTSFAQDGFAHGPTVGWMALGSMLFAVTGAGVTHVLAAAAPELGPGSIEV